MPVIAMSKPSVGDVRKLPSGRWQARYTYPDKVRRPAGFTFLTKRDATEWLSARHTDVIRAGDEWPRLLATPKAGLVFSEYARGWIARREVKGRPIAEWTRVRYVSLFEKHLNPSFGQLPLTSITRELVQQWYSGLLTDHPTTRAHAYSLLRAIFRTAARERLVPESPVDIEGAGSAGRKRAIRIATIAELETIVQAMPDPLRLAVLLGSWCALRYGEVAELRRSDVLVRENGSVAIHVQRGVTWPQSATKPLVGPPKSDAGIRTVAVPPHIAASVREHLRDHAQWGRNGLLFPSKGGAQIHAAAFHKTWARAREAAGRPDLRFHDLRHTGLTLAAQSGATIGELMLRAGHSTPAAAMRYQQASAERDQAIAERMSKMAEVAN
jgi:integrase